jgi:uncharacterized membrane protein
LSKSRQIAVIGKVSRMTANVLLVVAGTLAALLAGLFFGYAVSVNGGLGRLGDRSYLAAMQNINRVIVNPVFLLSFLGPVVLLPLAAWFSDGAGRTWLLVAAWVLHLGGGVGVTASRNIPLNNRLEALKLDELSESDLHDFRVSYEKPWNSWHLVRTIATIAGVAATFTAATLN